jgi:hypothetical protein
VYPVDEGEPPLAFIVADPLLPPKQKTLVFNIELVICVGEFTKTVLDEGLVEHPLISLTMIGKVPPHKEFNVSIL